MAMVEHIFSIFMIAVISSLVVAHIYIYIYIEEEM